MTIGREIGSRISGNRTSKETALIRAILRGRASDGNDLRICGGNLLTHVGLWIVARSGDNRNSGGIKTL